MGERLWKDDDEGWSVQTTSWLLYEGDKLLACVNPEGEGQWSIELFEYRHHAKDIGFTGTLDQAQDFAVHVLAWYEQHGEEL